MSAEDSSLTDLNRLARLVDSTADDRELWRPEEFGAIFRHQLTVPLRTDLGGLDPRLGEKLKGLHMPDGRPVATFGDLLRHPAPPVALLDLVKEFAKKSGRPGRGHVPPEVATMLYYLTIGVALFRCGHRLTRLDASTLREGFHWARSQLWADEATRELLRCAEDHL
ncbi:MAG TPA: hypothetical protein VKA46_25760 [Gemmataceae bacterium]|nr:hypothetical protein [Gemmataceae bacterium]